MTKQLANLCAVHETLDDNSIYHSLFPTGFLRQTNCRDILAAIIVQKRREVSLKNLALADMEKKKNRTPRLSAQHPYHGYGARLMAQQRQDAAAAATAAAAVQFQSLYEGRSPAELRAELEDRTGRSTLFTSLD